MSQATQDHMQPTIVYGGGRKPDADLPRPGLKLRKGHVGIVVTDPQNDFLSPNGVTWSVVGQNVTANRTVENIGQLFATAKELDIPLFISPHYYFPHDHKWEFEGALEQLMHDIKMFDRPGPLDTKGIEGSGADWLEQYKRFINDGQTIVCSPHKVYGPQSNDLVLQLRKRRIEQVILAGMSANLCVEPHDLPRRQNQGRCLRLRPRSGTLRTHGGETGDAVLREGRGERRLGR